MVSSPSPRARNVWAGFGCGLRRGGRTRGPTRASTAAAAEKPKVKSPARRAADALASGLETIAGGAKRAAEGAAAFAAAAAAAAAKRARTAPTTGGRGRPRGARCGGGARGGCGGARVRGIEGIGPTARRRGRRRRRRARRRRRLERAAGARGYDSFPAAGGARARARARPAPADDASPAKVSTPDLPLAEHPKRPTADAVGVARARLDAVLRASRSSPALMGVSSAGPSSAESRGWTSERALAFEEHLRAHKFNIFAISRMGTGRKKPSDPPRAAMTATSAGEDAAAATNDADAAAIDGDSNATADGAEGPDPRLEGRSLLDMVDYYYNVWLTRPGSVDDDGDRSECEEDDVHPARATSRRKSSSASASSTARSASERELARLASAPVTISKPKPKSQESRAKRRVRDPKRDAERASKDVEGLLRWLRSAATAPRRAAKTLKRAPSALDARARMMTRWRAAWLEGMDADEGEPRERAVEEGKRVKEGFEALTTRRRKYPQFPIAEVAFSSDDEA